LIERVELKPDGFRLAVKIAVVDGTHGSAIAVPITRSIAMRLKRRGVELRLVIDGHDAMPRKPDPVLLKALAQAHRWFQELASGRALSLAAIAARERVADRYVERLIRRAFLASEIVEAVAVRGEPVELRLTPHIDLPLDWTAQKRAFDIQ
jgi:site-specific DNA recombinase